MKIYRGDRTIDGIVVTVNDAPLDLNLQVASFAEQGFEWSYEGSEPRQLALALLVDHLGESSDRVIQMSKEFMQQIIARLDNTWEMSSEDIDRYLSKIES